VFTYRLHLADGSDAGQATYSVPIKAGEEIMVGNGRRYRVVDVVPFDQDDDGHVSKLMGMLKVEAV
jgi:hypothetical protein